LDGSIGMSIKSLKYSVLFIIGFVCSIANGKEILMAFGQGIPPYIIEKRIREDFNLGLSYLQESGEFQKIVDNYI